MAGDGEGGSALAVSARTEINRERLQSWQRFQQWIDGHSDSAWVFRGLGDLGFQLVPTIGRIPRYSLSRERAVLASFRRRVPQFVSDVGLNDWEHLALAQHHGVPTRLLDWTTNPLVAAYFAASAQPAPTDVERDGVTIRAVPEPETVDCRIVATRVRHARVIEIDAAADPFGLTDIGFVLPRAVSNRIGSQSGLFSVHPTPDAPWLDPLKRTEDLFDIPGDHRDFFLRRLFYLGVDPLYLMGGLDGLGARAAWQGSRGVGVGAIT